jgi:adenosylcobinamide-GDP ribazoletransferase
MSDSSGETEARPSPWGVLRAAIAFLTRIPVGAGPITQVELRWAPAAFPLIGGALGAASALVFSGSQVFGTWVAACLAVAFSTYVTGAFHEDGLADTADALGGAVSRERALEIMKDSRIGSYGTAALVLVLVGRIALLVRCEHAAALALIWAGSAARMGPVWLMSTMKHAAPESSKCKDLTNVPRACPWVALAILVGIGALLFGLAPYHGARLAAAAAAVLVVTLWFARLGWRRLSGITGDLLGACEQMGEVAILLAFACNI